MNKQKIKKLIRIQRNFIIFLIFILGIGVGIVFSASFPKYIIPNYISDNNSHGNYKISIKNQGTSSGAYYINNRNNSTIIGNYFEGYYYDSLYGWFKLDWSPNINENVRIINGTNKCSSGYGYNLGGKAKSENGGMIDFAGVYYCLSDKKLHGKGYNKFTGYQDFEGITFEIITKGESNTIKEDKDDLFVNDENKVEKKDSLKGDESKTSNAGTFKIGGNEFYVDDKTESIFYIIK